MEVVLRVVSQIGTFSEIAKTFHRHFSGKSYDFVKKELVINETSRKLAYI